MNYSELKNYQNWIIDSTVDHDLFMQIQTMSEEELFDAFSRSLEFGTAGIRGVMGPGSNRVNIYTIRKTALAFGRYLLFYYPDAKEKGVAIAHDNRFMSRRFCEETAGVLTGLGIKAYIFDDLRPTPELSYAVRKLGCIGGVVITASHNPKQYNGFKVYDHNGCQLTPDLIEKFYPFYYEIENELSIEAGCNNQLLHLLDEKMDLAYYHDVLSLSLQKDLPLNKVQVVYSPQHGTGYKPMKYLLEKLGYKVIYVTEQCTPDPNFSKTLSPNPEDKRAYNRAIELAQATKADIIITTDPDADRIGVVEMLGQEPHYFTGNQIGALLIHYILQYKADIKKGVMFDTVVTSQLGEKIAKSKGVKVVETLTGFKFMGEQIALLADKKRFFFAYEESYGYLLAPFVRDKDAFQAAVIILEMKAHYKQQGKLLKDVLDEIYAEYGYHFDEIISIQFEGVNSTQKLTDLVKNVRTSKVLKLGNIRVSFKEDYLLGKRFLCDGSIQELTLPTSNVIRFVLEDSSEVAIRPSGTEPKCKIYYNVVAPTKKEALKKLLAVKKDMEKLIA